MRHAKGALKMGFFASRARVNPQRITFYFAGVAKYTGSRGALVDPLLTRSEWMKDAEVTWRGCS